MEELEKSPVDKKGRIINMKANKYTNAEIADALGVSANTVSNCTSPQIAQALDYMDDPVNHPSHYTDGKYETIEFIERHGLSFHEGNAIKYISRAGKKDPGKTIEDLEKALWYIKRASNMEDYNPEAITSHDYILDKKLSPALASALVLIEAGDYEKAECMLEAEIKRLKKEKDGYPFSELIEKAMTIVGKKEYDEICSKYKLKTMEKCSPSVHNCMIDEAKRLFENAMDSHAYESDLKIIATYFMMCIDMVKKNLAIAQFKVDNHIEYLEKLYLKG